MSSGEKPDLESQHEKPLESAASQATSGFANPPKQQCQRNESMEIKVAKESESGKGESESAALIS